MSRLDVIAALIRPCPPPDIAHGYDLCPCRTGCSWPCPATQAAWIARGLHPDTEIATVMARIRARIPAPDFNPGGWDPDLPACWADG